MIQKIEPESIDDSFFLSLNNIILKNKLNYFQSEKKKLNQIIFKLEQKLKNSKPINNEKGENGFIMNNNNVNIIEPYRKKKRKRRKKKDIQNIYNCPFNNIKK